MTTKPAKTAAPKPTKAIDAIKAANAKVIAAKAEKDAAKKAAKPEPKAAPTAKADELAAAAKKFEGKTPVAPADAPKEKKARVARTESQSENTRKIVDLASRPEGATKAELEAATGWKNAGWPWMFFNPKTGKGIAPRHGMKLVKKERPAEGKRPQVAYCLVKER